VLSSGHLAEALGVASSARAERSGRMKARRVVTGHTRDGKATVASDTEVDAITLGLLPRNRVLPTLTLKSLFVGGGRFAPCLRISTGAERASEAQVQLPVSSRKSLLLITRVGVLKRSFYVAPSARARIRAVAALKGTLGRGPGA
jgi:hypothetical protein